MYRHGFSHLLPDKGSSGKKKTKVIESNQNPVWEDHFTYEKVSLEELSRERGLEITVWDFHKGSSNNFIGGVRIGPPPGTASKHEEWMDSIGDEVSHWEAMLTHPTEWVEQWHTLRPTMDPRDVLPTAPADSKGAHDETLSKPRLVGGTAQGAESVVNGNGDPSSLDAEASEVPSDALHVQPFPTDEVASPPPPPLPLPAPPALTETEDIKV